MQPPTEPEAAVAIVHVDGAEESVLLMRRTERADDPWSGHWSFPGGRREPRDADLVETALRELEEECGIRLGRESLEATLSPTFAGRRVGRVITVAPFLFRADHPLPTVLDHREAAEAQWIPLALLRDPARHCLRPVPRFPREVAFPAIELNGVPLWGFTYRVLAEWLGLHPLDHPEEAGFAAARVVLDFLLAQGLTLRQGWRDHAAPGPAKIAQVEGAIPVAAVLERFALPGTQIPKLSMLEVRHDSIRVVGLAREEYLIEASRD
jgi:8-oxo-dGTP pyrophosphatase MutT (NUDIX family)